MTTLRLRTVLAPIVFGIAVAGRVCLLTDVLVVGRYPDLRQEGGLEVLGSSHAAATMFTK